jgi:DNA-binding NarL/FixJ family response regulator
MTDAPVRILLADDQPLVRTGVRRVLESTTGFEVVGEAANGDDVFPRIEETAPDVLVLDLSMPGRDGFSVLEEIRRRALPLRVLVLSLHVDPSYVARAVRAGADGYLVKDTAVEDLPGAIRAVVGGQGFYSSRAQRALTAAVRGGPTDEAFASLTAREVEVLRRVASGRSSKEIGAELFISARTVESHRASLARKLKLNSVADLTRFAIERGLLDPP